MSMYLGMTKDDYVNVLKKTPRSVADKLGIENASVLSDELLDEKIRLHYQTAFFPHAEFCRGLPGLVGKK